ncbi:GNAT family acetyltransferase [Lactobacillus gallinarum]|nr:GNAT family acetyltransferase [Lactobacillus gallinarum]
MTVYKIDHETYQVRKDNELLGTIKTYRNLYHDTCIYLKIKLKVYPANFPFDAILQQESKPLELLTDSKNNNLIKFLIHNGFQCKRHCFTPTVSKNYLKHSLTSDLTIQPFTQVDPKYLECCDLLYRYYKKTHATVAPLTANYATFIDEVPTKTGFYNLNQKNEIENVVFTENNEIAYICSINHKNCEAFIQATLRKIFSKYNEIFFEADDTDWAATLLLDQFNFNKNESFNTYIYD